MRNKIFKEEQLIHMAAQLKEQGKKIAATSGCFDILHSGHVNYLYAAKDNADILIVLLNSDNSVKRLKGSERPIVPENERAVVIAGLECVDYVCMFDDDTPCRLIEKIQPDIWVKGGDYAGKQIPEMEALKKYGGEVKIMKFVEGCSSTNIIRKIKDLKEKGNDFDE